MTQSHKPLTILAIDDDMEILHLITEMLSPPHTVHTASDGVGALAIYQNEPIDLIILDLSMPKKSGLEVIKHVRKLSDDVAIVVISGADDELVHSSLLAGANFVLRKPFNLSNLRSLATSVSKFLHGEEAH